MVKKRYMLYGSLATLFFVAVYVFVSKFSSHTFKISVENVAQEKNIVPVVVIGSGPAGLSAALYTARADYKTVVAAGPKEGGQLLEAAYVENWPAKEKLTGLAVMADLRKQAESFGVQVLTATVEKVDFSSWPFTVYLDTGQPLKALTIIAATGGSQRLLNIPGVQTYLGKGVGVCTICDAPFEKGKDVVVIGGG